MKMTKPKSSHNTTDGKAASRKCECGGNGVAGMDGRIVGVSDYYDASLCCTGVEKDEINRPIDEMRDESANIKK